MTYQPETWMGDLSKYLSDKPVNKILVPATHDSGAYGLDISVLIPHTTGFFNFMNAFMCFPCVNGLLSEWSVTQDMTITEQLVAGIRHFDLRVAYENGEYYLTHSFVMEPLSDVISQFQSFVSSHPKELIFIQVSVDSEPQQNFSSVIQANMWNMWNSSLDTYIYSPNVNFPTYSECMTAKRTVFIFFDDPISGYNIWGSSIQDKWINTPDVDTQINGLNAWIPTVTPDPTVIYGIQFVITPDTNSILSGIFTGNFLASTTQALQAHFDIFFNINKQYFSNFSFLEMDFPTSEMIATIINFNTS